MLVQTKGATSPTFQCSQGPLAYSAQGRQQLAAALQ